MTFFNPAVNSAIDSTSRLIAKHGRLVRNARDWTAFLDMFLHIRPLRRAALPGSEPLPPSGSRRWRSGFERPHV